MAPDYVATDKGIVHDNIQPPLPIRGVNHRPRSGGNRLLEKVSDSVQALVACTIVDLGGMLDEFEPAGLVQICRG